MAEGYSTESMPVAATFAALELAKGATFLPGGWDMAQRAEAFAEAFKTIYAAVREAQTTN